MKGVCAVSLLIFSVGIANGRQISRREVPDNFKVCLEVLLLDCDRTYKPDGDETVCGNNGITYSNLCHYAQARCAKPDLKLVYSGYCGRTTPAPEKPSTMAPTTVRLSTVAPTTHRPTTMAPTTMQPTTVAPTTAPPTTMAPTTVRPTTVAPTTHRPTTMAPTTVWPTTVAPTTDPPTTMAPATMRPTTMAATTAPPTTMAPTSSPVTIDPGLDIIKQIFCQQADHIVCNSELEPICGTDGIFYLNRCMFAKAECNTDGLKPQHLDLCKDV